MSPTITIDPRFNGPPNSSNGGYACGRLAAFVDGPAEVTLRRPPPLGRPLAVVRRDGREVGLMDGEELVAEARPAAVDVPPLDSPGFAAAEAAAARSFPVSTHPLPTCFVCGPGRERKDGLDLRVGPLDPGDRDWTGELATPWVPAADLAGPDGLVRPEFVWAALDCPTGHATGTGEGMHPVLLGRQAVEIRRRPRAGERCVVASKLLGRERRKFFTEGMLFGEDGEAIAWCKATWIEVDLAAVTGAVG